MTFDIATQLHMLHERIAKAGGDPNRVRVVAVTKTFGPEAVIAALEAGIQDIGENYAQEARVKAETVRQLRPDLKPNWHFIGHIQTNKVKMLAPFINTWESVDSQRLVSEIANRAPGAKVFIEVNLMDESGRGGCSWDDVSSLVEFARNKQLDVQGLMGIGPLGDPQLARPHFRRLAKQAEQLELGELSMGMSEDLEVAVQEGATIIRIGRAFFGSRPHKGS